MTTITISRAVAEQALEALEQAHIIGGQAACDIAITALRAALAQQAEPVEPVAWYYERDTDKGLSFAPDRDPYKCWQPLTPPRPQRKPLTEEMEARCPYAKANPTLRGAFFDGWLNSERAHGIKE